MVQRNDFKQYQKPIEALLTTFLARPFSRIVTAMVADVHWITPNQLTLYSLILGLAGCLIWLKGTWIYAIIGTIIFHLGYILDCSDGELARYRGVKSLFGEALDPIFDRILEFSLIFCATFLVVHDACDLFWYSIGAWAVAVNFLYQYIDLWLNRLFATDKRFEKKKRFILISPSINLSYREVVLYFLPFTVCIGYPHAGIAVIAFGGSLAFPIQLFRLWKRAK